MQEQPDSIINKLILRLRSLAKKLERFAEITEHRMNHRSSIWFYDHAKAYDLKFKSLCIYALITPNSTAEINHFFGRSTTGQPLRKRAMFGGYWIDEADSYFQNDVIGNLDLEKAKWGKYKQFDVYNMLWKNLNAFFAKEPEEIIKYLKNDIDNADLQDALGEIDQVYVFVNTAIETIPLEFWKGEMKAFSNSIKRIERFLNNTMFHAWISAEIELKILPEIAYMQEVFEFKTHAEDPIKGLLDFIPIDENKITFCLKTMDSRLDEIKQIQSKFYEFCNDLNNLYVMPNFMLREKMDANGKRLGLYMDDVVKDLEKLSTKYDWLQKKAVKKDAKSVLEKAYAFQKMVEILKSKYDPIKTVQINEFLSEIKIAKAIASKEFEAMCDYKSGVGKTDVDFKIDTPDGAILLEVTAPRKSDFVKEHTQHFLMDIDDRSYPVTQSMYVETPEHIKLQDVILNKCTKKVCVCHEKAIKECPDKKLDNDLELAVIVEPIKFPVKQGENSTLHAIVVFENDLFDGDFDMGDYSAVRKTRGLAPQLLKVIRRGV
ncbi:MAG: hypothetical protein Q8Q56_00355 [Alphaproteobacteria bacterium]|nr:hypothetical protein [Alphaproteobacteria bacterium]